MSLSIIVPAPDEEQSIVNVIDKIKKTLENCDFPYEIIVVDDGSTDKTGAFATALDHCTGCTKNITVVNCSYFRPIYRYIVA